MHRHIYYFIAASLVLHSAAVLVILMQSAVPKYLAPASASSAPVISVALLPAQPVHKPAQPRRHKPRPVRHVRRISAATPAPDSRPSSRQTTQNAGQPSAANPARQAELQRKEVRDRVLSRLQINLRRYISYPPLARRQGWQGRVLLAFSIEADGKIRNIHVAAGSGYAILDSSAVAALAELQRLQPAAALPGQRLELQLPVIYRLQGG
ncbi:MAG: energy transducer TonB [Gammaproteobacteria bacterium]